MAMGAFLAGVLLASSEYRHALESDIEPFKGLLLGLFFIGVGMSIDFGTLIDNPIAHYHSVGRFPGYQNRHAVADSETLTGAEQAAQMVCRVIRAGQ